MSASGICDVCHETKEDVRDKSDHYVSSGIGVCTDCIPVLDLRIGLVISKSSASQESLCQFIHKYHDNIKLCVINTQLKGSIVHRAISACQYFFRVNKRFFFYKVWDSVCSNKLERMCKRYGIIVRHTNDVNHHKTISFIRNFDLDLMVSVFSNQIFRGPLLNCAKLGVLNVHGSILPHYRGVAQYWWYKQNKDTEGGVTVHFMDEGVDSGDIVRQQDFGIIPQDTLHSIHYRIAEIGVLLVCHILEKFVVTKQIPRIPQASTTEKPLRLPT